MITRTIDLAGQTIHYADFGGDGPTFVLVHGLGGSHTNWLGVGQSFARRGRTVALDLPGFGRTPRDPRGTSLRVLGDTLARFIDAIATEEPVHLVGNSMGGTLSLLEGHARPGRIASTLLVCPALPAPLGTPVAPAWMKTLVIGCLPWGHKVLRRYNARVGAERLVRDTMALCCVDPSRVSREVVEASVALAAERQTMPWGELAFSEASRSLLGELLFGKRVPAAIREPGAPTVIIQGQGDLLVHVTTARRAVAANPQIGLIELPELGHTPQLEAPDTLMEAASRWVDRATSSKAPHGEPSRHARTAN
jgi:pimeloyl-ACP methyl ester carboxylesterase